MANEQTTPDIWSDPNLLSMILGQMGSAVMGEHQDTWQSRLGQVATGLGASRKAALAAEKMSEMNEEWKRKLFGLLGGGEPGIDVTRGETSLSPRLPGGEIEFGQESIGQAPESMSVLDTYLSGTSPEGMNLGVPRPKARQSYNFGF